jgi:hypothetical protein
MMKKIYLRSEVVWSALIFAALAFTFTYLNFCFFHKVSALSGKSLALGMLELKLLIAFLGFHLYSLYLLKRTAIFSFILYHGLALSYCFYLMTQKWNNVIFVALGFYFVFIFINWLYLSTELEISAYQGNVKSHEYLRLDRGLVKCHFFLGQDTYQGIVTNWDKRGCFVRVDRTVEIADEFNDNVDLKIHFRSVDFSLPSVLASIDPGANGFGFFFKVSDDSVEKELNNLVASLQRLGFEKDLLF